MDGLKHGTTGLRGGFRRRRSCDASGKPARRIFFETGDREAYCGWLKRYADRYGLKIRAWRLMTNHVHPVAEPEGERTLSLALGHGHG